MFSKQREGQFRRVGKGKWNGGRMSDQDGVKQPETWTVTVVPFI